MLKNENLKKIQETIETMTQDRGTETKNKLILVTYNVEGIFVPRKLKELVREIKI